MQKNEPITENSLTNDGTSGEDYKLLALQKAFNDIVGNDEEEEKD